MTVTVKAYPRIHCCLIDLGGHTLRKYGGAGFAVNGKPLIVEAAPSRKWVVNGLEKLDERGRSEMMALIGRIHDWGLCKPAEVTIVHLFSQHIGLGSKTALLLSTATACQLASKVRVSRKMTQKISGRGGTSGVGIQTYFSGRLIIDAGHEQTNGEYAPSSARMPGRPPVTICKIPVPRPWRFHLIEPPGRRLSGQVEVDFFRQRTPIPRDEVLSTLSSVYHGLAPSFINGDLYTFKNVLIGLHNIGFKRRELEAQTREVRYLFESLQRIPDCAVGLSSMGPLIYAAIRAGDVGTSRVIEETCEVFKASVLDVVSGRNRGYEAEIR